MEDTKQIINGLLDRADRVADQSAGRIMKRAAKRLEELEAKQRWIPVTERLPEVTKEQKERIELDYLLAPEFNVIIKGAKKATTLYYDGDGSWFDMGGTCYPVAYWMPLPKPQKEE